MSAIDYDLTKIKGFAFDVDGVLSPATVQINTEGVPVRMANVKDGFAIRQAVILGYPIAIITGGNSEDIKKRYNLLGVTDVFLNSQNKKADLEQWMKKYGLGSEEVLYMGDDIPDLQCMRTVGLSCTPFDGCHEAKMTAVYVSKYTGGYGSARDVIEQVLRAKRQWKLDSCASYTY
ncbi:MAG: HAD hydrolase-like protein [Muribaculaceae bacterium]|nr:HAD hydrolase-like protein [Muribaculaceae bacterium]